MYLTNSVSGLRLDMNTRLRNIKNYFLRMQSSYYLTNTNQASGITLAEGIYWLKSRVSFQVKRKRTSDCPIVPPKSFRVRSMKIKADASDDALAAELDLQFRRAKHFLDTGKVLELHEDEFVEERVAWR